MRVGFCFFNMAQIFFLLVQKVLAVEDTWELWLSEFGVNADVKHSVGSSHAPPLFHPPSSLNMLKIMFQQSVKEAGQQVGGFLCTDTETCLGFSCLTVIWLLKISILGNNGKASPEGRDSQSTHDYLQTIVLVISSLSRDKPWWTPATCLGEMQGAKGCPKCSSLPGHISDCPKHNPIIHWQDELCLLPLCCAWAVQSSFQSLWVAVTPSWMCFFTGRSLWSTLTPYKLQSWRELKKIPFYPSILLLVMAAVHKGRVDSETSPIFLFHFPDLCSWETSQDRDSVFVFLSLGWIFIPSIGLGASWFKLLAPNTFFGNEFSSLTTKNVTSIICFGVHQIINIMIEILLMRHCSSSFLVTSSIPFLYYRLLSYPTSIFSFLTWVGFVNLGFLLWKLSLQQTSSPTSPSFF